MLLYLKPNFEISVHPSLTYEILNSELFVSPAMAHIILNAINNADLILQEAGHSQFSLIPLHNYILKEKVVRRMKDFIKFFVIPNWFSLVNILSLW